MLHKPNKTAPAPLTANADFVRESALLSEFNGKIGAIDREVRALEAADYARRGNGEAPIGAEALERAKQLLAGVPGANRVRDLGARLADLHADREVLTEGRRAQAEIVEQLRGRLSVEAAKQLAPRHREALAELLEASRKLAEAAAAERSIRIDLVDGGYLAVDGVLPPPRLAAALVVGDEAQYGTPLFFYAEQLRGLGIPT